MKLTRSNTPGILQAIKNPQQQRVIINAQKENIHPAIEQALEIQNTPKLTTQVQRVKRTNAQPGHAPFRRSKKTYQTHSSAPPAAE